MAQFEELLETPPVDLVASAFVRSFGGVAGGGPSVPATTPTLEDNARAVAQLASMFPSGVMK